MTDLRSFLGGAWRLYRTVTGGHVMEGEAVFAARPDGMLRYSETGFATLAGADRSLAFARSYFYAPDGSKLRIFFDEPTPRLFQDISLNEASGGWRGTGVHLCAPDTYRSEYAFERGGAFRIRHAVEGPLKSYLIETRCTWLAPV